MMTFFLLSVAESTQLQNQQTESKKVQLEQLELTKTVAKNSEYVHLNSHGIRPEALRVSGGAGALLWNLL